MQKLQLKVLRMERIVTLGTHCYLQLRQQVPIVARPQRTRPLDDDDLAGIDGPQRVAVQAGREGVDDVLKKDRL